MSCKEFGVKLAAAPSCNPLIARGYFGWIAIAPSSTDDETSLAYFLHGFTRGDRLICRMGSSVMSATTSITKGVYRALFVGVLGAAFAAAPSQAATVYLKDYATNFQAYDFNTGSYYTAGLGYVGCGPTTAAMILNYFTNQFGAAGLMEAGGGLATANTLHGPGDHLGAYMQTGTDGFGSVYRIEPGIEGYATGKGYDVDALIHVSPTYDVGNPDGWNAYGPFGSSWTNDGDFWQTDGTNWWIDDTKFYNFVSAELLAGVAIFLTVDSDGDGGGDHWVPLVGVSETDYYYYNTYDTTLHQAAIKYVGEGGGTQWAISLLRTIAFNGGSGPGGDGTVPEPGTLGLLLTGLAAMVGLRRRSAKR